MPRRPTSDAEGALYVRLPADAVEKIDRASEALGVHKKDLIAGLVTKYVDPDSRKGLTALGAIASTPPRRDPRFVGPGPTPTMGTYPFQAYDSPGPTAAPAPEAAPEVMNLAQAAQLLQVEDRVVLDLAESRKLPGRKIGKEWRFSRTAILTWLAGTEDGR